MIWTTRTIAKILAQALKISTTFLFFFFSMFLKNYQIYSESLTTGFWNSVCLQAFTDYNLNWGLLFGQLNLQLLLLQMGYNGFESLSALTIYQELLYLHLYFCSKSHFSFLMKYLKAFSNLRFALAWTCWAFWTKAFDLSLASSFWVLNEKS